MKRIVYLKWEGSSGSWTEFLDFCSQYTPLIEPFKNETAYLDLSGCGDSLAILQDIGRFVFHNRQGNLRIGLAASRPLARIAAGQDLTLCPASSYQVTSHSGIQVIEVLSEHEKEFLCAAPLTCLELLSPKTIKKLFRFGFMTVGDLNQLSPARLGQLTGENPYLLLQKLNGLDPTPVKGLYPPSRLTYSLNLEEGPANLSGIEIILGNAAKELETLLAERHAGCRHIRLEMHFTAGVVTTERDLSSLCYHSGHLLNILLGLLTKEDLPEGLSGLLITLQELEEVSFCQPDLFSQRVLYEKNQREGRVQEVILNLQGRFPGSLQRGIRENRREQVLSLWDPWRRLEVKPDEPSYL